MSRYWSGQLGFNPTGEPARHGRTHLCCPRNEEAWHLLPPLPHCQAASAEGSSVLRVESQALRTAPGTGSGEEPLGHKLRWGVLARCDACCITLLHLSSSFSFFPLLSFFYPEILTVPHVLSIFPRVLGIECFFKCGPLGFLLKI